MQCNFDERDAPLTIQYYQPKHTRPQTNNRDKYNMNEIRNDFNLDKLMKYLRQQLKIILHICQKENDIQFSNVCLGTLY